MPALLELEDVHTYIGQHHILQGVTFSVPEGGCAVLLGRNGAGKTTALRTVMGLLRARSGRVALDGIDIGRLPPHRVSRLGVGFVPEDRGVFRGLTVAENLALALRGAGRSLRGDPRLDEACRLFPDLARCWNRRAGTLSGGQQQMLAIARALLNDNRILLIDEPSKGLAPIVVEQLTDALIQIKAATTVLLVEQNLTLAAAVGDRCFVLDSGRTVHAGAIADLMADDDLQRRYLGVAG